MVKKEALSEYELQRQANIAKNQALLKELQLNAASAGLGPAKPARTSTGGVAKAKPKRLPKVKEEVQPRRTSSRLQGIVADSEVAKRKAEDEADLQREADKAKRQRVSGDLKLGDIVVAGQDWNQSGNWLHGVKPAQPYERTFGDEDISKTADKDLRELREKMSALELWEGIEPARIKITPERIYSMSFHPTPDKALVFAGDKLGSLGLFDASQPAVKNEDDDGDELDSDYAPAITTFKPHTRTISTIHFTPTQPQAVYTSSYDSSIRKIDLEKSMSTEIYAPADSGDDEPLSGICIPADDPNMLYFTSLNGVFGMHDTRTSSKAAPTKLLTLSEKKIGGFSVHPLHPHLLATASLDRTLKLWDLRKISGSGANAIPALVAEHESRLSVSHAAFNAAGQIATTSYDDTIKIYNLENAGDWTAGHEIEEWAPNVTVPHNNQTGRWVTILKPHWQLHPTAVGNGAQRFCIGNMNRFVDVYAGTGEQVAQLGGPGISAVPAVASFHENQDWIAAGTASGKLCLWM
jgi:WD40 repeat protein